MMLVPRRHNDLFEDFFDDPFFKEERHPHHMPLMKTDVRENENSYIIDVDLPGFKKEDIKIDVENGYLNINAKTDSSKNEEEKGQYIRRERYTGECSRSFYIGEDIEDEEIQAKFENGILCIEVPKKKELDQPEEKKYIDIQ